MRLAIAFLALLSTSEASSLRGEADRPEVSGPVPTACFTKGGSSQTACDASTSEDGSACVWCSLSAFGLCVSEDIASHVKQTIPGVNCDDDVDDDDAMNDDVADDDAGPAPEEDDDVTPSDDSVPSDYWKCLEDYENSKACLDGACAWCENKGGYGLCLSTSAAEDFDGTDWYSCTMPSISSPVLKDPYDMTCVAASFDESTCTGTSDSEGNPCEWCSLQGHEFCLDDDQAELMQQLGVSCGDGDAQVENLADPSDPSCLLVTIGGDESGCKATSDVEGNPCEWCSFQGYEFCMNTDQAAIAEGYGADCGDRVEEPVGEISDPGDLTCIAATLEQDESACKGTMDSEGNACEWCSFQGYEFCMNTDQAAIAEGYGADCGDRVEEPVGEISDPGDLTCIAATLEQDESACKGTMDSDGKPCEWCSFQGYEFCMNTDQAAIAEGYGADCGDRVEESVDANKNLSDPNDMSCLAATLDQDESACKGTMDSDGNACEWCSLQGFDFCMNADQAAAAEGFGASCDAQVGEVVTEEVSDPNDLSCLIASLEQDKSGCKDTIDSDGNHCEWCSLQGYEFCLNTDQAAVVEAYGAECDARAVGENKLVASIA